MKRVQKRMLGSTDLAAVTALYNPKVVLPKSWGNAADVWLRLVHQIERKAPPSATGLRRGTEEEAVILECYRKYVGPAWRPDLAPGEQWIIEHPSCEWFTASPDAFYSPPPTTGIVEIKAMSLWAQGQWGSPGSDQIPERYLFQVAWAMACCEASEALVLVAFGVDSKDENGNRMFLYERTTPYHVERDVQFEKTLLEYGQRFINDFVVTRKAPPGEPRFSKRAWKRLINGSEVESRKEADGSNGGSVPDSEERPEQVP